MHYSSPAANQTMYISFNQCSSKPILQSHCETIDIRGLGSLGNSRPTSMSQHSTRTLSNRVDPHFPASAKYTVSALVLHHHNQNHLVRGPAKRMTKTHMPNLKFIFTCRHTGRAINAELCNRGTVPSPHTVVLDDLKANG